MIPNMSASHFFAINPEAIPEAVPMYPTEKDDEFLAFWEDLTTDFEHFDTDDHSPTPVKVQSDFGKFCINKTVTDNPPTKCCT